MSLRSQPLGPVPEETAKVVKSVSRRKPHPYVVFADGLGEFLEWDDFTEFFPKAGQSAIHPARLALSLLVQAAEGWSDRELAEQIRMNLALKYLLRLPLDHEGYDASVFAEFRERLLSKGGERLIFYKLLERAQDHGLLKPQKQRTDSTFVLSAARSLNRVELIFVSMRACLEELSAAFPLFIRRVSLDHWVARYYSECSYNNFKIPTSEKERLKLTASLGVDVSHLLDSIAEDQERQEMQMLTSVRTLHRVFDENFDSDSKGGPPHWRQSDELKPSSEMIASPKDADARVAFKRQARFFGYKAHFTETFSEDGPHLITDVYTTAATMNDSIALPTIYGRLKEHGLQPATFLFDGGYVQLETLKSICDDGVEVVAPIPLKKSWQSRSGQSFDADSFIVDWKKRKVYCPNGAQSAVWKNATDRGNKVARVRFSSKDCSVCPFKEECTKGKQRSLTLKQEDVFNFARRMQEAQKSDDFRTAYKKRSGIEGTISQAVRRTDARRSRYSGLEKTSFANFLKGAALNFIRISQHLMGVPLAATRTARYPLLMAQPA